MTATRHKPSASAWRARERQEVDLPSSVIDAIAAWAVARAAKPPCPHCAGTGLKMDSPAERDAHNRLLTHALNQALDELALQFTLQQ